MDPQLDAGHGHGRRERQERAAATTVVTPFTWGV
jgi:hypothetical protein